MVAAVLYSGHVAKRSPDTTAWVEVYNCSGGYAAIYLDKDLSVPMSNPLVVDRAGDYHYYSSDTREKSVIHVVGSKPRTTTTCKEKP